MSNGDERIEVRDIRVPPLGFGTWLVTGEDAAEGVRHALEIGRRQIDTARAYDNEQAERNEIALLPTEVRTANPPWAPDPNA